MPQKPAVPTLVASPATPGGEGGGGVGGVKWKLDTPSTGGSQKDLISPAQGESMWKSLLVDASASRSKLPNSTLLFLGDATAGKTSLVQRFCAPRYQEEEEEQQPYQESVGRPLLSYSFFEASDPADNGGATDLDDAAPRVNVWSLSDPSFKELLQTALSGSPADLSQTAVLLALDLSKPWSFEKTLTKWVKVARDAIDHKLKALSPEQRQAVDRRQAAYLAQCYGGSSSTTRASDAEPSSGGEVDQPPPSLPPGVLEVDLGVPLIIVGLKADLIQKGSSFEETQRQDYVQQYLRSFCLKHGAALFFTSSGKDATRLALHRYILHRLYPETFPFAVGKAQCEVEQLLVPAGWDSKDLIAKILSSKVPWAPNATFNEVMVPPKVEREEGRAGGQRANDAQESVSSFDDRPWLEELQQHLEALGGGPGVAEAKPTIYTPRDDSVPRVVVPSSEAKPSSSSSSSASGTSSNTSGTGAAGSDNAQIRNFFEGLLAKK